MHARWIEGGDHGLVWEHGLAIVESTVSADAARRLWEDFAGGGDLAGFLKLLSVGSGSDLLSLPAFAIALRAPSGDWQLAARGSLEVRVDAEVVRGADISTWAERFVPGGRAVRVGVADAGADARPIVAGLVPARGLAWGDQTQEAPIVAAVRPAWAPPVVPAAPEHAEPAEPVAAQPADPARQADEGDIAVAAVEPVEPVVDPEGQRDVEPEPAPEPDPEPAREPDPEPAPEPDPEPEPERHVPRPADQETMMTGDPALDEDSPPSDAAVVAQAEAAPGRFARQFGDTQMVSVEDAAVREHAAAEFISSVPGSSAAASPGVEPADDEVFDDEDHDGHTVMMSADAAARLASAAPVPPPEAVIVGPSVLGVTCLNGHANPPHRASCSTCGAEIHGEPRRMARPPLGTLLLPNGERLDLTAPVIVGRNPRADRVQGGTLPTLVPLSQGHVSGTHLEFRLEEWNVLAVDLHSTNGTFLRRHGEAPVRLGERPELLIEGDVLDLGHGVQLTLEHLR